MLRELGTQERLRTSHKIDIPAAYPSPRFPARLILHQGTAAVKEGHVSVDSPAYLRSGESPETLGCACIAIASRARDGEANGRALARPPDISEQ